MIGFAEHDDLIQHKDLEGIIKSYYALFCMVCTIIAIKMLKLQWKQSKISERVNQIVSVMFSQLTNYCIYKEKSRNTTTRLRPHPPTTRSLSVCQTAELASALRKPQVIFHLSMCGIFHALVMPAAPFIVCAGSTNDDLVINLAYDVTDLAPVRQQIDGEQN